MREDDVNLPWQYVLLGFFAFGAIFALLLLDSSRSIRVGAITYLAVGIFATPLLLRSGRRRFRDVNPDGRTFAGALRQPPPPMSRSKRIAAFSAVFGLGLLASLLSFALSYAGGIFIVFVGMMGTGLIGVIAALLDDHD